MMKKMIIAMLLLHVIFSAFGNEFDRFFVNGKADFENGSYVDAKNNFLAAMKNSPFNDPTYYYWLGRSYIAMQQYEKAYEALSYFVDNQMGKEAKIAEKILPLLEKEMHYKDATGVYFVLEKLPPYVNSSASDSAPVLTADGNTLYFTSLREGKLAKENVWKTVRKDGMWRNPMLVEALSSNRNESMGSLVDDETAYLFGNYRKTRKGDIYISRWMQNEWQEPRLVENVNTKNVEMHPYVYKDSVMFFTSIREDCIGGSDIYVSVQKEGLWQEPMNLGATVNTPQFEQTPFLDWDGRTLFFASNGHYTLGGYDIFRVVKTGDTWQDWSEPENLGVRINSVRDDRAYYRVKDSDYAYISSDRVGGQGFEDIYQFNIKSVEIPIEEPVEVEEQKITIFGKISCDTIEQEELEITEFTWNYLVDNVIYKEKVIPDSMGNYQLEVLADADKYSYLASAKKCFTLNETFPNPESDSYELNINFIEIKKGDTYEIADIHFEFNKAELTPESLPILDKLALTLANNPEMIIEIAGHTDSVGSEEYNLDLSQKRAQSVVDYLVEMGINCERLIAKGYGESVAKADNDTEEGRALNRRVEMEFVEENGKDSEVEELQEELIRVKAKLNAAQKKKQAEAQLEEKQVEMQEKVHEAEEKEIEETEQDEQPEVEQE